jgi:uncharacterized membrane protein YbaN (DUF454 family)
MLKPIYLAIGLLSVALGVAGIFLPLLPTVPFLILAAFCFARSNPRLESWLLDHPLHGPHIRLWRERGAISRRGKQAATLGFAFSIALALALLRWPWPLATILAAVVCLTWIWRKPES